MMNRRKALLVISATVLGGVGQANSTVVRFLQSGLRRKQIAASSTPAGDSSEAVDRLRRDLARLDSRVNSEEGVPVFLGCINLVPDKIAQKAGAVALTALNRTIAAEFRQTAAAWERLRPNPTEADVAHVIEVLAYRDSSGVGKEQHS